MFPLLASSGTSVGFFDHRSELGRDLLLPLLSPNPSLIKRPNLLTEVFYFLLTFNTFSSLFPMSLAASLFVVSHSL